MKGFGEGDTKNGEDKFRRNTLGKTKSKSSRKSKNTSEVFEVGVSELDEFKTVDKARDHVLDNQFVRNGKRCNGGKSTEVRTYVL